MTFYYAMLFPIGFFLASCTLTIHYWTDKFCLLRVWAPAPRIGTRVAEMSRTYFLAAALLVYAFLNSYSYASFPFDNACRKCKFSALWPNFIHAFVMVACTTSCIVFTLYSWFQQRARRWFRMITSENTMSQLVKVSKSELKSQVVTITTSSATKIQCNTGLQSCTERRPNG